jgi:threonine/homoserine/homoserine lactone efflux protein
MDEILLFIFGVFATILAVGPLVIAAVSESSSKKKK